MTAVLYALKKFIATFFAMFLMISGTNAGVIHSVKDADNCRLNFAVLSDVHMEGNDKMCRDAFIKIIYDVKNNDVGCDSLVFLGDNTMNGQNIENMFFYGILDKVKPAKTVYTAMGNHDSGNGIDDYDKRSARFWNYYNVFYNDSIDSPYYYKIVNGYYFIFLGSEYDSVNTAGITEEQICWLDSVLKEATADGKPAFVFNHHPYFYMTRNTDLMTAALTSYKNVFYFSGHTHTPSLSVWDIAPGSHYFNIPRCTEQNEDSTPAEGLCGLGLQVEVYDSQVEVRLRNYYDSKWICDYTFDII